MTDVTEDIIVAMTCGFSLGFLIYFMALQVKAGFHIIKSGVNEGIND